MRVLIVCDIFSPFGRGSLIIIFNWFKNLNKNSIKIKILINDHLKQYIKEVINNVIYNKSVDLNFI